MLLLLENPEEIPTTSETLEMLSTRLRSVESLTSAHELAYEIVVALVNKVKRTQQSLGSTESDKPKSGDEEYVKLEKELQKYEAKVRTYIRVIQDESRTSSR